MTVEILVACRLSPERLVGATTPIAVIDVGAAARMWLWYPAERTSRLHRETELAAIVSVTCVPRWADFGIDYAKLIARRFDGMVSIDGEVLAEVDPVALDDRAFAIAWRDLDHLASAALEQHVRAMRRSQLTPAVLPEFDNPASAVWLAPVDPIDITPLPG